MLAFFPQYFGVALALMVVIWAVVYALNKLTPRPQYEAWLQEEAFALVMNVIYFIVIIVLFSVLSDLAAYYVGVNHTSLIDTAAYMLSQIMDNKVWPAYADLIHQVHAIEVYGGFTISGVGTPGFDVSLRVGAGMDVIKKPLIILRGLFPMYITSLTFQIITIEVIRYLYDALLPFALVLRIFPFTREAGNEILAVVLAFSVFLPVLYIILIKMMDDVSIAFNFGSIFKAKPVHSGVLSILFESTKFLLVRYATIISVLFNVVNEAVIEFAYIGVVAVLVPTFAFMSTISMVRSMQNIFEVKI